jgi:hypothetical protein
MRKNAKRGTLAKSVRVDPQGEGPARDADPGAPDKLHRVSVLVSTDDLRAIQAQFAIGQPTSVMVHPPRRKAKVMSEAQREWRKAYRRRPEVKERIRQARKLRRQYGKPESIE